MTRSHDLAYWITERYNMKTRREQGLPPKEWTADVIMRNVRWCNVHREDDKVTKWLAENWRPNHHAVWEIVLARMINYIPSLNAMLIYGIQNGKHVLKTHRATGAKIFTSAYTISTCGRKMDKLDYVFWVVAKVRELEEQHSFFNWQPGAYLEAAHQGLTSVHGLGSFLAAQVLADLKNTAGHPLQAAPDWQTWAAPGPGSLKGLAAFYGRPSTPGTFVKDIRGAWEEVKPLLPDYIPDIHMQDFQNCLCEFSKYVRVKDGNGHIRNRYRPQA